ncbi:glycosyltransferase family 4 protein [Paenibacillus sp. FSL R7-0331]|uniref:glycosyltransferase family 4 protein n=1 Tax=Paenibacillus sp. FSL R7-0331 TaxID=1536773 RepID=UPI0004F8BA88|nr:glycosyltransferase family 4 protein [Paenibacillus sp. FSL R7-0331]AIQ54435.1 hypothetical protein R70331_24875 [Paenibacillus sp. FSL R7-0331]
MKKVLYVAPLVVGFQDILEGQTESRGLPSFILPLKKIQESYDYQADIVLISNFNENYRINVDWLSENDIVANINNDLSTKNKVFKIYRKLKSSFQLFNILMKATKEKQYEVIYCHGKAAIWGNIVSLIRRVPCAYRLYGTSTYYNDLMKYGKFLGAIKNPIYSLIFKLPKKFLMITDDGSHGDKVYEMMKPKLYDYPVHFLLNGVDHQSINKLDKSLASNKGKYIFHAGRIDQVKRQDRNINILKKTRDNGNDLELYLAGHYDVNSDYYRYLKELIQRLELDKYVHFLGPIKREELKVMSYYSVCTLLMGDIANNGSVFYEVFSTGSIVVGLNDDGLREFIDNQKNGFLVENDDEAADVICEINENKYDNLMQIKNNAIITSKEKLLNWNDRVDLEIRVLFE